MPAFLQNLSPQQRRLAIAALLGIGAAVVVVLRRGRSASSVPAAAGTNADPLATDGPPGSSTFADNGQALGALGSNVTDVIGELQRTNDRLDLMQSQSAEQAAAAAAAAAANAAANAASAASWSDPSASAGSSGQFTAPAPIAAPQPAPAARSARPGKAPAKPSSKGKKPVAVWDEWRGGTFVPGKAPTPAPVKKKTVAKPTTAKPAPKSAPKPAPKKAPVSSPVKPKSNAKKKK